MFTLWTCIKLLSAKFWLNCQKKIGCALRVERSWSNRKIQSARHGRYIPICIYHTPQPFTDISQYYRNDEITEKNNKTTIYLHFHTNKMLRFMRVCVCFIEDSNASNIWQISISVCRASSEHRELNSLAGAHLRSRSICKRNEMQTSHITSYTWKMAISIAAAAWKPTDSPFRWFGDVCFTSVLRIVASPPLNCHAIDGDHTESFDPHNRRTTIHAATNSGISTIHKM